jgi:hypothetical protein
MWRETKYATTRGEVGNGALRINRRAPSLPVGCRGRQLVKCIGGDVTIQSQSIRKRCHAHGCERAVGNIVANKIKLDADIEYEAQATDCDRIGADERIL